MAFVAGSGTVKPMKAVGRWAEVEVQDSSGVHTSEEPIDEAGWRKHLGGAVDADLPPAVEALLGAHLRLRERHKQLELRAAAIGVAIDRLPIGVAVLMSGTVIASNSEAERLIDGDLLKRAPTGELVGGTPPTQRRLDEAMQSLGSEEAVPLRLDRESTSIHCLLLPVSELSDDAQILVMSEPKKQLELSADVLRTLHRFTPTEARVASHLVMGFTPREIANELGVGVETTRTHVKHILGKMKCHRQVDAVRHMVLGPALML